MARFEILQWLYGPEKFPGLSRNGLLALLSSSCGVVLQNQLLFDTLVKNVLFALGLYKTTTKNDLIQRSQDWTFTMHAFTFSFEF